MAGLASPLQRPADAIDPSALGRVLVVMLRHHGDVLLTSPVFTALKRACPNVCVDALVYAETASLVECNPDLDQVHRIERGGDSGAEWRLFSTLRSRRYDLIVHLSSHKRGAWLARGLRPRWSVAPARRDPDWFWDQSFTHLYRNAGSVPSGAALARRHTVEQNLDALRRLGLPVDRAPALTLVPGPEGEAAADTLLAEAKLAGPFVLVQPTSRWAFKCWPAASTATLLSVLTARGHTVILSAAPDPREQAMIDAILGHLAAPLPRLVLATRDSTLPRLAALAARARLFVGIDSAPMHIAAAMGTPTVALFGPSGEFNWGPWRGDGRLVARVVTHTDYPCRPCGQDGCGGGKVSDCLVHLPVSQVLSAIDEVLAESDPLALV